MDDRTRLLLFEVAAFLKITFVDKLIPAGQASKEAAELSDKIGKLLAEDEL